MSYNNMSWLLSPSQAFLGLPLVIHGSTCNLQAMNVQRPVLDLVAMKILENFIVLGANCKFHRCFL
jgi:hypothetical protein